MKQTSGSGVLLTMRHPARTSDSRSTSPMRAWCSIISTYPDSPRSASARNSFKPMNRRDHCTEVVYGSTTGPSVACRHVGGLRAKRLADGVGMPAEEHAGAHRDREPFVRVAGDRVGRRRCRRDGREPRGEDRRAAPRRVDVEPQLLRPAEPRQIRQRIDRAGGRGAGGADDHDRRQPVAAILDHPSGEIRDVHLQIAVDRRPTRSARRPMPVMCAILLNESCASRRQVDRRRRRQSPEARRRRTPGTRASTRRSTAERFASAPPVVKFALVVAGRPNFPASQASV